MFRKMTDQVVTFVYKATRSLFAFPSGLSIAGCAENQCVSSDLQLESATLRFGAVCTSSQIVDLHVVTRSDSRAMMRQGLPTVPV
jgi:hypothetical protein